MIVSCPKCEKEGHFVWLGEPDNEGTVAMMRHANGTKQVKDFYTGHERVVNHIEMCFLNISQIAHLEWFKRWKTEYDEANKKRSTELDELYKELYWKEDRERIQREALEDEEARELAEIHAQFDDS